MRAFVRVLACQIFIISFISSLTLVAQGGINHSQDIAKSYQKAKAWHDEAKSMIYVDPPQSLNYIRKGISSLELYTWGGSSDEVLRLKVDLYNLGGIVHQSLESPQEAIEYFRKAVGMSELLQYEEGLLTATEHLAQIRNEREKKNKELKGIARWGKDVENHINRFFAQKPFEKSVRELEQLAIKQIASLEERRKHYDKALQRQEQLLEMYEHEGDSLRAAEARHRITSIYHQKGDFKKGLDYTYASDDINIEPIRINDSDLVIFSVEPNLTPKSPKTQAIAIGSSPKPVSTPAPSTPTVPVTPPSSASPLKSAQSVKQIPEVRKRYEELKKQLKDFQLDKELDSLELAHKLIEQEKDLLMLKQEMELEAAQIRYEKWLLFGGLGLLVAALLFFIGLLILRNRSHKRLAKAYNELDFAHRKLKMAQAKLVESEKLASLGQLTAGIAHEINNPVNFISGNIGPLQRDLNDIYTVLQAYDQAISSHKLQEKFADVNELKEELEINYLTEEINSLIAGINEGASRTSEIVKGLRTFARMDEDVKKPFDIHQGIDSTLTLLNHQCQNIELKRDYADLPNMEAFPGKLNQVFMNILTNAIHAMGGEGTLEIKTRLIKDPSSSNIQSLLNSPIDSTSEFIQISIKDSGKGIPEAIKKRIFEPFFTTKDVGEGTGLGLPICKGIVEDHHGNIEIFSEEGKGTEVRIMLPLVQAEVVA